MVSKYVRMAILITLFSVVGGLAEAQEAKASITIEPQEKWLNVFGGEECVYHFQVMSTERLQGRAGWSLRAGGRTILSSECALAAGPGKAGLIEIHLEIPPVKEGVVLETQFVVDLYGKGVKEPLASWEKTLYIFAKDPFTSEKKWLKELKIGLFDPEKKTSEMFEELEIPFDIKQNINALPEFDGRLFIVGSGLDFAEYRGLWEAILQLSARGVPVLVLAPAGGEVVMPGVEGVTLPEPAGMQFLHRQMIHELDKTLDADAWPPDGKVIAASMVLKKTRTGLVGEFSAGDKGWPWFEIDFTGKRGEKLVICGFGMLERMEAGPTPRFLLARLFEYLSGNKDKPKKGGVR